MARKKRRTSVNRYAGLNTPEDTLDFHVKGVLSGSQIKAETLRFVQSAQERGLKRIRIITGRGIHSTHGPVVRPQVERTLSELQNQELVQSWHGTNFDQGGDGAFDITLA